MMKYLSVLVFALVLTWTWFVVNSEASISLETHVGIQNKLGNLIRDSILTKKPQASNITILDLWTEPVKDGDITQIRAHFAYRFEEPGEAQGKITSELSGEALMEPSPDDGSGLEKWVVKQFVSTSDSISFSEPLVIATGDQPEAPAAAGGENTGAPNLPAPAVAPSGSEPAH